MEVLAVALLVLGGIFWALVVRYYYDLCIEISQYAENSMFSPAIRTAIVGIHGFGLVMVFALFCVDPQTPDTFLIFSVISPLFNYFSIYIRLAGNTEQLLTSTGLTLALAIALIVFSPFWYALFKTRKEIEIRFQIATGGVLKKKIDDLKLHHVSHGNPTLRGLVGATSGIVLFPWYLYFDLFKAMQGSIVYRKIEKPKHPNAWAVTEHRLEIDVGETLEAADEVTMGKSTIPLCPKCKKPLVYLEDQKKWWCQKCKKAAYVK
jgi:uncharacterized membrane protein YuzA (DUF378 family)